MFHLYNLCMPIQQIIPIMSIEFTRKRIKKYYNNNNRCE